MPDNDRIARMRAKTQSADLKQMTTKGITPAEKPPSVPRPPKPQGKPKPQAKPQNKPRQSRSEKEEKKFRLPHGAIFHAVYDALLCSWSATLTVDGETIEVRGSGIHWCLKKCGKLYAERHPDKVDDIPPTDLPSTPTPEQPA